MNVVTGQIATTLRLFESLGDDRELSLVQRLVGAGQTDRLRFDEVSLDVLLDGLSDRFADLVGPGRLPLDHDADGQTILATRSGLRAVVPALEDGADGDVAMHARMLRRTLLQDLASGGRIWVRKANAGEELACAYRLLAALRRHGTNRLLWVLPEDDANPAGSVAVLEDGLLCGRVAHFARDTPRLDICVDDWLELCQGARLLTLIDAPPGEIRLASRAHVPANLLEGTASFHGGWWQREAVCVSAPEAGSPAPPEPDSVVMTHRLTKQTDGTVATVYGRYIPDGLRPGAVYVASLWVNIPQSFDGDIVGVVCDGFDSLELANADLARRGIWQRVWVQTRIPGHLTAANPSLYVVGPAASVVHTACWKLELGFTPSPWRGEPRLA